MADIARNKKAFFNYQVLEKYEAGLSLQGTEVKSCRAGHVSLQESYIIIEKNEAFLIGAHIAPYEQGNRENHSPMRQRKLLLHKKEILKLQRSVDTKGLTIIPLSMYFKKGLIKLSVGLCRGKDVADKRETLKKRDSDRNLQRLTKRRI